MLKDSEIEDRRPARPMQEPKTGLPTPSEGDNPAPTSGKSGKFGLFLMGLLVVAALVATAMLLQHRAANAKKAPISRALPPVTVVADTVRNKDVPIYLDGLGTVQAFNTVTVHVRVDGQLQKVAFSEGQDVHTGDLLAQIDPAPYRAQLEQSIAKKAQDAALLLNAHADLDREVALFAAKIDSEQVYTTQKALVDQYDAAVKADQAAIDSAKVMLSYTSVTSPLDGRTGIRLVDQGNIVHATDTNGLVVITQLRPISVIFTLPEQMLADIREHSGPEAFKVQAVDRDNSTVLDEGSLTVIDNQIDPTTGTLKLKASFPNRELRLWPGQFVNARLLLTMRTNGVVVPAAVVQRGPQGDFAYVIASAGEGQDPPGDPPSVGTKQRTSDIFIARMQPVTDLIIGSDALIESGLNPGQRVVAEGQYKLQDGSAIRISPPPKSAEGAGTNRQPVL